MDCPNCETKMEEKPIVIGDNEIGVDYECPSCNFQCEGGNAE